MSGRTRLPDGLEIGKVKHGRYRVEGWDVEHIRHAAAQRRWQATSSVHPGAVIGRRTLTEMCTALHAVNQGDVPAMADGSLPELSQLPRGDP